jgi:hypothetical protein
MTKEDFFDEGRILSGFIFVAITNHFEGFYVE